MSEFELENFQLNNQKLECVDKKARENAGDLNELETTDKASLVGAINELRSQMFASLYPVGCVIHSTTCATEEEVVRDYGGSQWILHTGYMLRGADSGVSTNHAYKDGGSDDAVTVSHSHTFTGTAGTTGGNSANPTVSGGAVTNGITGGAHTHKAVAYRNNLVASGTNHTRIVSWNDATQNGTYTTESTTHTHNLPAHSHTVSGTHTHTFTPSGTISTDGVNGVGKNIPAYKNVYIWERIA